MRSWSEQAILTPGHNRSTGMRLIEAFSWSEQAILTPVGDATHWSISWSEQAILTPRSRDSSKRTLNGSATPRSTSWSEQAILTSATPRSTSWSEQAILTFRPTRAESYNSVIARCILQFNTTLVVLSGISPASPSQCYDFISFDVILLTHRKHIRYLTLSNNN